jgi:DNA polymerase-1
MNNIPNFIECTNCPTALSPTGAPGTLDAILGLSGSRPPCIPPEGNPNANIIIVGEGPGDQEVAEGRPFVGPSGQLLNAILRRLQIPRADCYITNACLCYIKNTKDKNTVFEYCTKRLINEIDSLPSIVGDRIIIALGNDALHALVDTPSTITSSRGFFTKSKTNYLVMPTLHPAYILRQPEHEPLFTADFGKVEGVLRNQGRVPSHEIKVRIVKNLEELTAVVELVESLGDVKMSLDTETTGFNFQKDKILCLSIALDPHNGIVIPLLHGPTGEQHFSSQIDTQHLLRRLLHSATKKVLQGGKFDFKFLRTYGLSIRNYYFDNIIAHHLIDENLPHDLNTLISMYTLIQKYDIDLHSHLKTKKTSFAAAPDDVLWEYAGRDAVATLIVSDVLEEALYQQGLDKLFWTISMPTQKTLVDVEYHGILVSQSKMKQVSGMVHQKIADEERKLFKQVGHDFNYRSPRQLSHVLYTERGLRARKTTKAGAKSTDAETLEALSKKDRVAATVLNLRKWGKLQSTYLDGADGQSGMLKWLDSNSRLHANFNVAGTHTGRLSSSGPNLQNIPRSNLRNIFTVPSDYVFIEADYNQAELRAVAWLSGCQALMSAFNSGEDVHKSTACKLFSLPPDQITEELRVMAKFVNFGIIYGRQAQSVSYQHNMSLDRAQALIDGWFAAYPEVRQFMVDQVVTARNTRFLRNTYGRIRHFPSGPFREEWERQAFNFPVQSIIADTTNRALSLIVYELSQRHLDAHAVLQLHDAIYVECKRELQDEVIGVIKEYMTLPVPGINYSFPIDISVGTYWKGKHSVFEDGSL